MPLTLLSMEEVSQRYRLPLARLQRLIRDGKIRTVHLEGQDLIPDEDVAMVAGQTHDGNGNGRWIPLAEAIALLPEIDENVLRKLVKDGIIASKTPPDSSEELVDKEELLEAARELDRGKWRDLQGREISVREASRKYGLRSPSLSRWAQKGHIRVLGNNGYQTFLDESDVVFAAVLAKLAGRRGRALFP